MKLLVLGGLEVSPLEVQAIEGDVECSRSLRGEMSRSVLFLDALQRGITNIETQLPCVVH